MGASVHTDYFEGPSIALGHDTNLRKLAINHDKKKQKKLQGGKVLLAQLHRDKGSDLQT